MMRKGVDYPGIAIVFACHDGNGNFLLSKRSVESRDEKGMWAQGGGALELGDTEEYTLRKEIMEEYCTEVIEIEYLGHREVLREQEGVKTHWIAHDFKVLIDRSMVKNGEPHKADEIGWFSLEELPSPMYSQWSIFYELYKDKLSAPSLQ